MSKHILETCKWGIIPIVNYRGVEVIKTISGYTVLRQNVSTAEEVDQVIDAAAKNIQKSLNNEKE